VLGPEEVRTALSVRLKVADEVGVLAGVAGVFAGNGISIESVRQSPANGDSTITIVSHVARLGDLMRTVEELRASASVHEILSVTAVESD